MAPGERRYVLLPREGLRTRGGPAFDALTSIPRVRSTENPQTVSLDAAAGGEVRIIDSAADDGPKLVEINDAIADILNGSRSPVRAVPIVEYPQPDILPRVFAAGSVDTPAPNAGVEVTCTDAGNGRGVAGVRVVAYTDFEQRLAVQGFSDDTGNVGLPLQNEVIERVFAYPPPGYWGAFRASPPADWSYVIPLTPIDLSSVDSVRHYYGNSRFDATIGVRVGVVDTGIGPHPLINLEGGRNTVTGEPAGNYQDGAVHGTHVAGLVGANGSPPTGLRGVAPGVAIGAYRVFPVGGGATNYAILKALIQAADDGCDIVNLSLGGGPFDPIVAEAILDARTQGMLVVVAAGNDYRSTVNFPAAYAGVIAVSAMGRAGTFPPGSLGEGDILRPPMGTVDEAEFIAAFSNVGAQIAMTAPGVDVLSTLPGGAFGPLGGTSMAAPVVSGAAACLLSRETGVYSLPRTATRTDAIQRLLQASCVPRGFGAVYEGYGLPDPSVI